MHAVHLYWRARHCWSFYIYAWAFALQSDDRALVIRLGILRRGSISPRSTLWQRISGRRWFRTSSRLHPPSQYWTRSTNGLRSLRWNQISPKTGAYKKAPILAEIAYAIHSFLVYAHRKNKLYSSIHFNSLDMTWTITCKVSLPCGKFGVFW